MKKIPSILVIGALALLNSCSNGQAGADTKGAGAATSPATKSASSSSASGDLFSATIDGQTYGSSTSFSMFNIANNRVDDSNLPYLEIMLGDIKSADDLKATRTFRMVVATKLATVHLIRAEDTPNYGIDLDDLDGDMAKYRPDDVTLTVTGLTADRVAGNFKGRMYHIDPVPAGEKKSVDVEVKFDIPINK